MTDTNPKQSIALALASAQLEITDPIRSKVAEVPNRPKRNYAGLDDLLQAVRPVLARFGLAITQRIEHRDGGHFLLTELHHVGGEILSSSWDLLWKGSPQERGSELTYARRYTLEALVGVAATEDDDGAATVRHERPEPLPSEARSRRTRTAASTEPTEDHRALAEQARVERDAAKAKKEQDRAAKKEAEEKERAERQKNWDPTWKEAAKAYCGQLAQFGQSVEVVMDFAEHSYMAKRRPSRMDVIERLDLLKYLDTEEGRNHLADYAVDRTEQLAKLADAQNAQAAS